MFIFKFFDINNIVKNSQTISSSSTKFSSKFFLKKTKFNLVFSLIILCLCLCLFYILGYTYFLSFSLGLFKFLFWLFLIPSLFLIPLIFTLLKATSKALNNFPKEVEIKEIKD